MNNTRVVIIFQASLIFWQPVSIAGLSRARGRSEAFFSYCTARAAMVAWCGVWFVVNMCLRLEERRPRVLENESSIIARPLDRESKPNATLRSYVAVRALVRDTMFLPGIIRTTTVTTGDTGTGDRASQGQLVPVHKTPTTAWHYEYDTLMISNVHAVSYHIIRVFIWYVVHSLLLYQ